MASTNKTPQLGLNQWAAGDSVLREDFNGDNAKLDAAMAVALTSSVVGDYIGDGTKFHEINLGFAPHVVIFYNMYSTTSGDTGAQMHIVLPPGGISLFVSEVRYLPQSRVKLTQNGFQLLSDTTCNTKGNSFHYIAFR